MEQRIKEKIKKLLAMMDPEANASPAEVETALKKARKLMEEYKLSEKDLNDEVKEVIRKQIYGVEYTSITNPWVIDLCSVIADNYCCKSVAYTINGRSTRTAGVVGFTEDAELAANTIKYAYECIKKDIHKLQLKAERMGYPAKDRTSMGNAYGNGYVRGLKEAFLEQNKTETGFAMVLVTPQEVNDDIAGIGKIKLNTSRAYNGARQFDGYAVRGYKEGENFSTRNRLA